MRAHHLLGVARSGRRRLAAGDLSRKFVLDAKGEVAALKDSINQMISTLKETAEKNTEQDWLKTNLAYFHSMMQGQRNMVSVAQAIISELTPLVNAQQGVFYVVETPERREQVLNLIASYGLGGRSTLAGTYRLKESLIGQCAYDKKRNAVLESAHLSVLHAQNGSEAIAPAREPERRARPHGHDDAGDGRAHRDPRDPADAAPRDPPHRVAHREGHEG